MCQTTNKKNSPVLHVVFVIYLILLFYSVLTSVQPRHTKCCYVLFDIKISNQNKMLSRQVLRTASHTLFPSFRFSLSTVSSPLTSCILSIFYCFFHLLTFETSAETNKLSSLYVPYCAVPSQDCSRSLSHSLSIFYFSLSFCRVLFHLYLTKQNILFC